jgi:hypothetical protein
MKFIKKIKDIFTNNKEPTEQKEDLGKNFLSFITFCIFPENENDVFVKTDWGECTVESAILYAELLYSINNGMLEEYIFDILNKSAKTDTEKNFINLVIDSYHRMDEEEPLISPTKVLK